MADLASGRGSGLLRPTGDPALGQTLERRYRLEGHLGVGSDGVVYSARTLQRAKQRLGVSRVAVKVLGPWNAGVKDAIACFTHEAYLGSVLDHPNLARILDFGRVPDGRPYYVMPHTRGVTLDRLLAHHGPLSPRLTLSIVEDAASGLEHLHDHGLVHRDVKPANLFVALRRGHVPRVFVLDLGVVGVHDPTRASRLGPLDAGTRGQRGTPAYLAPEQALGHAADPRTDVYALACVTYRMLTGSQVFPARTVREAVRAHLFDQATPPSKLRARLPTAVDGVMARALAKARSARTPGVLDFVADLAASLSEDRS